MSCDGKLAAAIFKAVPAGIVMIDAGSKKIIDINPAGCFMVGVAREDIVGLKCENYLCAESCDGCPILIDDLSEGVENKEIILHRFDGSEVYALLTINSVILEDKRIFINTLIDITRQRVAEEKLNKLWAQAEELLSENVARLKNGV